MNNLEMSAAIKVAINVHPVNFSRNKRLEAKSLCSKFDQLILETRRSQFAISTDGQWQLELPNMLVRETGSEENGI